METAHPVGTFIASVLVWGFLLIVLLAILRSAFLFGTLAVLPMVRSKAPASAAAGGSAATDGGDASDDAVTPEAPASRHRTT